MDTYGLTDDQVQRIIEYVVQARDGLIYKHEMANKIEHVVGKFEDTGIFATADDEEALAQAEAIMNSTSTMAQRP